MHFLKKVPLWGWGIIILSIFLIINFASSRALNRSLFNMALDELREDQGHVVKQRDEWIATCEKQILDLQSEIDKVQKEKAIERIKAIESASEVVRLKGENNALQIQLRNIVVPDSPDLLIDGLRKRFPSIRKIQP
jgi:hypothetical protein